LSPSPRTSVQSRCSSHVQFLDDARRCVTRSRPLVRRHAPSVGRRLNSSVSLRPITHCASPRCRLEARKADSALPGRTNRVVTSQRTGIISMIIHGRNYFRNPYRAVCRSLPYTRCAFEKCFSLSVHMPATGHCGTSTCHHMGDSVLNFYEMMLIVPKLAYKNTHRYS